MSEIRRAYPIPEDRVVVVAIQCDGCFREYAVGAQGACIPDGTTIVIGRGYDYFYDGPDVRADLCAKCTRQLLTLFPSFGENADRLQHTANDITKCLNQDLSKEGIEHLVALTAANRQHKVADWVVDRFGHEILSDAEERAKRLVEEAIELAQASGVAPETIHKIANHVYSRPAGEIEQEAAGVGVTLLALAACHGFSLEGQVDREIRRIHALPAEHFHTRQKAKADAGIAAQPVTVKEEEPYFCEREAYHSGLCNGCPQTTCKPHPQNVTVVHVGTEKVLVYRGYTGSLETLNTLFHGQLLFLFHGQLHDTGLDVVTYEASPPNDIRDAFATAVDNYIRDRCGLSKAS